MTLHTALKKSVLLTALLCAACSKEASVEKRLESIDRQLASLPVLPVWNTGASVGWRSDFFQKQEPASPPSLTIDLEAAYPVDLVALVPARLFHASTKPDPFAVPQGVRVFGAQEASFDEAVLLADYSMPNALPDTRGYPILLPLPARPVRYIKIEFTRLAEAGDRFAASLSEVMVFDGAANVSVKRPLKTQGAYRLGYIFNSELAVDGQTPFGNPEHPEAERLPVGWFTGPSVATRAEADIEVVLRKPERIDALKLFGAWARSYQNEPGSGFPQKVHIGVPDAATASGWRFMQSSPPLPHPGGNPVTLRTPGLQGQRFLLRVSRNTSPFQLRLSEIQLVTDTGVLADIQSVQANPTVSDPSWKTEALIDGYTSTGQLIPERQWIEELALRGRLETEREALIEEEATRTRRTLALLRRTAVLLSLAVTATLLLMLAYRHKQNRRLERLREEIAADLHDEIGSNLAGIAFLGDYLAAKADDPAAFEHAANELADTVRDTSDSMKDIVWMLYPSRKEGATLESRLREITHRLLREIDFTCDFAGLRPPPEWDVDRIRHIVLFYKEALHNIARHSGATRIAICIRRDGRDLVLEITDNGIPFRPETAPASLAERTRQLNGTLGFSRDEPQTNRLTLRIRNS